MHDGFEYNLYENLEDHGPNDDTDNDGLTWKQEYMYGTSALTSDTDGDGASDAVEIAQGSDPVKVDVAPSTNDIVELTLVLGDDSGSGKGVSQ